LAVLACADRGRWVHQASACAQDSPVEALASLFLAFNPIGTYRFHVRQGRGPAHDKELFGLRAAVPQLSIDTDEGKAWHALGFSFGSEVAGELQECSEEELDDVLSGMRLAIRQQPPEVPIEEYMPKALELVRERMAAKTAKDIAAGEQALTIAELEDGAIKTASGLVVQSVTEGSGPSPVASDTVEVHYEGTLPDGTVFDSSYARGQTISISLSDVIKGWTEGLQLMKVGGKAKLTIPYRLAYGEKGSPPKIPQMATLIFTVELIDIK